ncbi:hypothetical protein [Winogradskyella sp.]|jgi:ABC-2 type transport system permease protein|uniref:hypothetical protein n=1 Tax=Winogradskyella sp. TaxID=1883156 RepID=UPI0025DE7400|nr:hypothetical protein [Winogradskyella sp.]MCT4630967.1 hypothetical protein [Winogradskyella sp.]
MKTLAILKYEWIHFVRNPFKIVALVLFILASIYGLHNASSLYHTQLSEIERIKEKAKESQSEIIAFYDNNQKGPSTRPWIDVTKPFWALWYSHAYHFKTPSPLMVYDVGQAEQYGYYKRITDRSSPYDSDMAEEIANPERLQVGNLDFTFSIIYLLPLLLLICLYNIKGTEADTGILPLITVQAGNTKFWLWVRVSFYALLIIGFLILLLLYGGFLTQVFTNDLNGFLNYFGLTILYTLIWTLVFGLLIQYGSFSINNTLKMVGIWLLFAFIIPGAIHQWVSTKYPANLMTDFIDAQRDERDELRALPDNVLQQKLNEKFPQILNSIIIKDSLKSKKALNESVLALTNDLIKERLKPIEESYVNKNSIIKNTYWINPTTLFQNKFNLITQTHFENYQNYRNEIQVLVDKQIKIMVLDIWNDVKVNRKVYLDYLNKMKITVN